MMFLADRTFLLVCLLFDKARLDLDKFLYRLPFLLCVLQRRAELAQLAV